MHLVRTLSTVALVGSCLPAIHALSIKDDVVSVGVGVRLQTRASIYDATAPGGEEASVLGEDIGANDPINFQIRRARLYLKIKYGDDWKGLLALHDDEIDSTGTGDGRGVQVRYAWIERQFAINETLSHAVHFGLDKPFTSEATMSSSKLLFPTGLVTDEYLATRGVGIGYRLAGPVFAFGADVQNNSDDPATTDEEQGLWLSARAEFSFSPDWYTDKRTQSFVGKEGHHLIFGLEYATNQDEVDGTDDLTTTSGFGADVLFHWQAITAFANYKAINSENDAGGATTEIDSSIWTIQAGYALPPLGNGAVLEPAIRYSLIDNNTDDDDEAEFYEDEGSISGSQIDIGLNYYIDGHDNKLQLAYMLWEAEEGEADANIIRLQHQLNF